jgi:hypothetical protein
MKSAGPSYLTCNAMSVASANSAGQSESLISASCPQIVSCKPSQDAEKDKTHTSNFDIIRGSALIIHERCACESRALASIVLNSPPPLSHIKMNPQPPEHSAK